MAQPGLVNGTLDSTGAVTISITPNQNTLVWRIYQVTIDFAFAGVCSLQLLHNGIAVTSLVTGPVPLSADGTPYVDVAGHESLAVQVTDATPSGILPRVGSSDVVTVSFKYDELTARHIQ